MTQSLRSRLGALHEERVRTWDPAKLQVNVDQRRELVDAFDPGKVAQIGDIVPPFELIDSEIGAVRLDELVADGPAVLIFFRFAGCPACNIALPYYEETLWPELRTHGIPLVAVSPQVPDRVGAIRERHGLSFAVASDPGNALARHLGISFEANAATRAASQGPEWIGSLTGTNTWELPQPTVLIIERDRRVRFIDVSPDWLERTEARQVLEQLDLREAVAA